MLWNLGDWLQLSLIDITLGNLALARNDFALAEKQGLKIMLDLQERAEVYGMDSALDQTVGYALEGVGDRAMEQG